MLNLSSKNNSDTDDKKNLNIPPQKICYRCCICNTKVGLLGFQCRCNKNKLFCSKHRYPNDHNCNFDFKEHAKKLLEKNNPIIISDKIDKL